MTSDDVAVAPSRIHRRGISGAADFHHRNLNGFSSASDSRSQLSASSPDSLDATNHNQSGDADSSGGGHNNGNSGRSSRNYYYRKLQSNESPSRRRVVRHRARRNVPGSLVSSSNGNESGGGGVPNGSIRSNTGSHASHLSKSSPSVEHAAAASGGGSGSRSSSVSNNSPTRMEKRHQRTRNGYEESFGSRNGSPFHHHRSCGSSKGRSASTEGRVNSGHISLDPRLHGGQGAAAAGPPPPLAAVPNPDYSPIMVRRRYYQDRIMLDRDASNFKYEDDKIKVRKNQIRLKSTTLQSPSQPPPPAPPPPTNLWGNAQRYKGSLENMLEAEQQQSSKSRAGMLVKDFLSRNSRRRRRGRMLSLPSRYVSKVQPDAFPY